MLDVGCGIGGSAFYMANVSVVISMVTLSLIEQCFLALSCNSLTLLLTLQLPVTCEFPFSWFRRTMLMFLALICPQI